uniref:Uncharacterized protein n=1 Tax=Anguilla anguilla TaxID=7936 RepID=A0A0E9QV16_ANGAN
MGPRNSTRVGAEEGQ